MKVNTSKQCPSCGRPLSPDTVECPYCSETVTGKSCIARVSPMAFHIVMALFTIAVFLVFNLYPAYLDSPRVNTLSSVVLAAAVLLVFTPNISKTPGVPPRISSLEIISGTVWRCLFCANMYILCKISVNANILPVPRAICGLASLICPAFAFARGLKVRPFPAFVLILISTVILEYW